MRMSFIILLMGSIMFLPWEVRAAPRILAVTFPTWLLTRNVTANVPGVEVDLMLPAGTGCPHDYALSPRDMRKPAEADILAINGLGLEAFLGDPSALNPRLAVADASQGLREPLPDTAPCAHGEAHACGHPPHVNPHVFASPRQVAAMSLILGERLAELDPERAALYRNNARRHARRLDELADAFAALGARLANRRIVTQQGVFDYLVRDAGLETAAVLQAEEHRQPSAADMLRLVRTIRERNAGAVFTEPSFPDRAARAVADEAGVPAARLDPVASGPEDAPLEYYETVMRANLRVLEQTLGTR